MMTITGILLLLAMTVCLGDNQGRPRVNVRQLLRTVTSLQAVVTNLEAKLEAMEAEMNLNKHKLNQVESEIAEQNNRTSELGENLNYEVTVLRGMSSQNMIKASQSEQKASQSMGTAIQSMNEVKYLKRQLGAGTVMFHVYMNGGDFYPSGGDLIPFRGVGLNKGSHFSTRSSRFTCPKRGYYYFTFSIYSQAIRGGTHDHSSAILVLNGRNVAMAYSQNGDPIHFMKVQGSNSAVVECPEGGQVWLKADNGPNRIRGTNIRQTTFSGFLLSYI